MRNHATRRYPKNFSHVAIQDIYEATFEDEKYSKKLESTPNNLIDMNENEDEFNKKSGSIVLDQNEIVDLEPEFYDEFDEVSDLVDIENEDIEVVETTVEDKIAKNTPKTEKQETLNDELPDWMRLD